MILPYKTFVPKVADNSIILESATVTGQVVIEEEVNIWYNTVVRGDVEPIFIGRSTNVQDLVMLHTSKGFPLTIGKGVTVGHRAILHGCTIEDNVLVGMGAILLDGAHIESNVLIGAGSVVTEGKRFPSGSLVLGSPARVVRQLSEEEIEAIRATARKYVDVSRQYKTE